MFCYAGKHLRPDLIRVVKSPREIGVTGSFELLVGTAFDDMTFNPAYSQKRAVDLSSL